MIKTFTVFVTLIIAIAVAVFFPQIRDAMYGMSVLEMLQQAVGFVLHVIVVSILAYAVYAAVEIVQPLIKTFRQKQRHLRRSIRGRRSTAHSAPRTTAPSAHRSNNDLLWLISQLSRDQRSQQQRTNVTRSSGEKIHWD